MKSLLQSRIALLILLCISSGCISDGFQSNAYVPEGVFALSRENKKLLSLEVTFSDEVDVLGHQYLFGLLPFTSLKLSDTKENLYNALFTHLVTSGFNLNSQSQAAPRLHIHILHGHCSAFDLLAIRKNRCTLHVRMELFDGMQLLSLQEETYSQSEYHRFGFKARLRSLMEQVLQTAAADLGSRVEDLI